MKKINFIFDKWHSNGYPIPNGLTESDVSFYNPNGTPYIHQIKEKPFTTNFNEITNNTIIDDGVLYFFRNNNIVVYGSDKIAEDSINFYLVMSNGHLENLDPYLDLYQKRLEEGHNLLLMSVHEMGEYNKFKTWINENPYRDKIYVVSPCYNFRNFYKCKSIFFPFFLFDPGKDFRFAAEKPEWSVCTKEQYLNTPKEKLYVSWNRNVRRVHRLILHQFLKYNNYLDKGYNSFLEFPEKHYYDNLTERDDFLFKEELFKFNEDGANRLDIDLDGVQLADIQNKLTNRFNVPDVYKKSYFSIVTETNYFENVGIITEKILRPLANFHPFIIIGSAGIYKELEKFGYQIPKLIDHERIDSIQNPQIRLKETLIEIKKLIDNFDYTENFCNLQVDILEHNQNLLLNFKTRDCFEFLYNKLYNFKERELL